MNLLLWYNGEQNAMSAVIPDIDAAYCIAEALKAQNFKVVWTRHSNDLKLCRPMEGYEEAYAEWQKEIYG